MTLLAERGAAARVRVGFNRDESRRRAPAKPPEVRVFRACRAAMPIDPESDGSWLAVTDARLVLAILNANPRVRDVRAPRVAEPPARASRGTIVGHLLQRAATLDDVLAATATLAAADYKPFRLVLADLERVASVRSLGDALEITVPTPLDHAFMFTSSGLGDAVVDRPRRELFDEMLGHVPAQAAIARQDEFHRHHWPGREHESVCMTRPDARTVSYTVVELSNGEVTLTYWPDAPDEPSRPISVRL